MKNTRIMLFAVILTLGAWTASAQIIYQQNFDAVGQAGLISPGANGSAPISSMLPGWAVSLNSESEPDTTVSTGVHTTLTPPGSFLASGDQSDFDFEIYSYPGPGSHTDSIDFTFTNTGSTTLTGIIGSFDFEAAWAASKASTPANAGFDNGLTYSINGGSAVSLPGTVTFVTNAGVNGTTVPNQKWLTDAQMNTGGLAIRNISFSLGSAVLNPGDKVDFSWSNVGTAAGRTMAFGLDNFELGDNNNLLVPEPSTWVGASLAMLMLGVQVVRARSFSKRREQGAKS